MTQVQGRRHCVHLPVSSGYLEARDLQDGAKYLPRHVQTPVPPRRKRTAQQWRFLTGATMQEGAWRQNYQAERVNSGLKPREAHSQTRGHARPDSPHSPAPRHRHCDPFAMGGAVRDAADRPCPADHLGDGLCIGWRTTRMWYVDPEGYRSAMGWHPDGY